ncbi:MAG TPA: response regulator [Syntrophorhabdales bacterium]|nr:response regulator [Syntrophorhabdales bacterium]
MTEKRSIRDSLIKTLRDVCKATAQLEKLNNDRVFTEQALDKARASYQQLMDEAPSALLLVDQEGNILASNKASETLLGYGPEELVSMNARQLYHQDASREFAPSFQQVLEDGAGTMRGLSLVRKGGQGVFVDSLFIVVTHEDKTFVQVTLKQAAERYKVQLGEKRYVQGLELLARTATGLLEMSHDENFYRILGNYIGKLVGDAYVIISSFDQSSKAFFVKAVTGPERYAEIILGLLLRHLVGVSFRISEEEFERYVMTCTPVAVSGGLHGLFVDKLPKEVYSAMEDFFLFGCTYIAGLTSDREVFGMATILMPRGARLDHPALVATLMQQASAVLNHRRKGDIQPTAEQPEPLIEGFQNILAEELPYPLEQYTAETERQALTESSTGTPPDSGAEEAEPRCRELRHLLGYRKILVVDDEEIVLDVTGGMLNYMGCRVGYAKNGLEAVARYKKALDAGEPFDAVILDLSLPGGPNAADTMKKLQQIHARVKVVGSTSSPDNPVVGEFKELGFRAFLLRPYKSAELAEALSRVLSESASVIQ